MVRNVCIGRIALSLVKLFIARTPCEVRGTSRLEELHRQYDKSPDVDRDDPLATTFPPTDTTLSAVDDR